MSSQSTIDSFFKSNNTSNTSNTSNTNNTRKNTSKNTSNDETNMRNYFYLKWTNISSPEYEAVWLHDKPSKINFINQVKCDYIKKGFKFYICGYFPDYENDEFTVCKENKYNNIHFLKSHLQKNIRRKDCKRAIPTALHLMKLDMNEFLRRMIIIHIEDTFLHKSMTTLLWLMIAYSTKKFKMKRYIYEWLLGFVYITCMTKKNDNYDKKIKNIDDDDDENINLEFINFEKLNLTDEQISILYSLNIRIAYGGLLGDKIMLKKCSKLWKSRFINNTNIINMTKIRPINIFVSELDINSWDNAAIDYHTNNNFVDFILKKFPEIESYEEIKKIIWYNSSGINHRNKNIEYKLEIWKNIENYVIKMQKYLLETNY